MLGDSYGVAVNDNFGVEIAFHWPIPFFML